MSCRKYERDIYLYTELSSKEKLSIDLHLQHCEACRKLLLQVQEQHILLKDISPVKAQLKNPDRLTSNIMQAIDSNPRQLWITPALLFFDHAFTRYSLAAASVFFIVFFLVEQQNDLTVKSVASDQTAIAAVKQNVTLSTSSFLKVNLKRRGERKSKSFTSLYACAISGDCDNPLVRYRKQKTHSLSITK